MRSRASDVVAPALQAVDMAHSGRSRHRSAAGDVIATRAAAEDRPLSDAVIVTCEHGGNHVPAAYRSLFRGLLPLLETHRGYDAGALRMASDIVEALGAPLVSSTVTRLLVDLNRSVGHRHLHHEVVARAGVDRRREILDAFYSPYRDEVERWVAAQIAARRRVVHLSSHSFTPVLDGEVRTADVGLLYDPRRAGEAAFCASWKSVLARLAPELRVRRNYPYAGKNDGLTSTLRKRFPATAYLGIELEVKQAQITGRPKKWASLRETLVESLRRTLAESPPAHA